MSDAGYQFHYFRQSADDRILWGGYDAIYHPGNARQAVARPAPGDVRHCWRGSSSSTFPQLDGIRFTHRWGGAIDTSTRFSVTFGETLGGRVHYALGYTGLGVGATRWAAGDAAGHGARPVARRGSGCGSSARARSRSRPSPRERPRWSSCAASVIASDANEGRRGPFLQAMDALGIGFDS